MSGSVSHKVTYRIRTTNLLQQAQILGVHIIKVVYPKVSGPTGIRMHLLLGHIIPLCCSADCLLDSQNNHLTLHFIC